MYPRRAVAGARAAVPALVLSVALGGCGGDSTGPGTSSLDQTLSWELLGYLYEMVWDFFPDAELNAMAAATRSGSASRAPLANRTLLPMVLTRDTYTFDETTSCLRGGNVRVQGTITDNVNAQGTGSVSFQFTQTPTSCRVDTQQHGVFGMNGNPNLAFSLAADFVDDEPAEEFLTAKYAGAFRWSGDGRTGTCAVDLTIRTSWLTEAVTVTGSLCGNAINFSG